MQTAVEYVEALGNYLQPACTQIDLTYIEKQTSLSQFTLNFPQKNEGAENTDYSQGSDKWTHPEAFKIKYLKWWNVFSLCIVLQLHTYKQNMKQQGYLFCLLEISVNVSEEQNLFLRGNVICSKAQGWI